MRNAVEKLRIALPVYSQGRLDVGKRVSLDGGVGGGEMTR